MYLGWDKFMDKLKLNWASIPDLIEDLGLERGLQPLFNKGELIFALKILHFKFYYKGQLELKFNACGGLIFIS